MQVALVTPSFHLDYELCLILIESVHRYIPADIQHFIVVSGDDLQLFAGCADARTHVIVQEDIVQERFWRVPMARRWRFNLKTLPVRGWIWQQMVKMSIANRIDADAYMIIDSDCFFVRPFDPRSLIKDDKVPIFREEKDWYKTSESTQKWADVSRRLLRLPSWSEPYNTGYICPWAFWRRDVLLKLQAHLANGREPTAWLRDVARCMTFSEYMLYGIYVDKVLGLDRSGHYGFGDHICLEEFATSVLSRPKLTEFKATLKDEALIMINAKSKTPAGDIRAVFGF